MGTGHPSPKTRRIKNRKAVDQALRRDGTCLVGLLFSKEYGPCIFTTLHPHHIINVGAGGDDAVENIISLCPRHHDMAQAKIISLEILRAILARFYGYQYG
jgi:hypothetical protein